MEEVKVGEPIVREPAPVREASAEGAKEECAERVESTRARSGLRPAFTSETAREAARRSAEARRAKREAADRAAELDRLTVRGRTAVVVAGRLTADELGRVIDAQLAKAKNGDKGASQELRQWLRLAAELDSEADDEPAAEDLASMTPAQRAALRAAIIKQAQERAADAEAAAAEHEA